jgi:hypothetical protein
MTEAYAPSSRRAWLAAGVGVALAAGGAGLVLRRQQQQARALTEVEQTLWQQNLSNSMEPCCRCPVFRGRH